MQTRWMLNMVQEQWYFEDLLTKDSVLLARLCKDALNLLVEKAALSF